MAAWQRPSACGSATWTRSLRVSPYAPTCCLRPYARCPCMLPAYRSGWLLQVLCPPWLLLDGFLCFMLPLQAKRSASSATASSSPPVASCPASGEPFAESRACTALEAVGHSCRRRGWMGPPAKLRPPAPAAPNGSMHVPVCVRACPPSPCSCRTCRKRFHGGCLYKWFKSSGKSNCPHCQSPW